MKASSVPIEMVRASRNLYITVVFCELVTPVPLIGPICHYVVEGTYDGVKAMGVVAQPLGRYDLN